MSIDFDQLTGQNANHKSISKIYDHKDFLTSFNKLEYDTEKIENILTSRPFRTFLKTKLDDFNQREKDQTNNDQVQIIIDEREKVSDVITKLDKLTEKFMCENKTVEIEPLLKRLMASDPKYQQGENYLVMNYFKENYLLGMLSLSTNILNENLKNYISNCFEHSSLEELDTYQMYLNPKHNTLVNALLETISKRYNELVSSNPSLFIKIISKITGKAKKNEYLSKEYAKMHQQLLDKKEQYAKSNSDDASTIKASEIDSYNQLLAEEKERMDMGVEDPKGKASPHEKGFFSGFLDFLLKIFGVKKTSPQKKTVSIKEALKDPKNVVDEALKDPKNVVDEALNLKNPQAAQSQPPAAENKGIFAFFKNFFNAFMSFFRNDSKVSPKDNSDFDIVRYSDAGLGAESLNVSTEKKLSNNTAEQAIQEINKANNLDAAIKAFDKYAVGKDNFDPEEKVWWNNKTYTQLESAGKLEYIENLVNDSRATVVARHDDSSSSNNDLLNQKDTLVAGIKYIEQGLDNDNKPETPFIKN